MKKKLSKAAFVRTFPPNTRATEVVAAGKKAGLLNLTVRDVWHQQAEMRKRAAQSVAADEMVETIMKDVPRPLDMPRATRAPEVVGPFEPGEFEALSAVCKALAPLESGTCQRIFRAACVMLGHDL